MKDLFPGFYRPTVEDFERLWQQATFVLDANVLLNLYRYPEKARNDLLAAFLKIKGRLWVPYQAALEYQRNRQSVVAEQRSRFRDVRTILEDLKEDTEKEMQQLQLTKRHANINPSKFIDDFTKLIGDFTSELDELEKTHLSESKKDELRERIESLLKNSIGSKPSNQTIIDNYYKEGEVRFTKNIPPGYLDRTKEKDKSGDDFCYGGLHYKRKFGDLVVWKQILEHAKENNIKDLIFVTDDDKEDWWWTIEAQGKKKLGPRPELVDEFIREAGGERFYMYSSEQFLEFAKTHLHIHVSIDSITQVTESKEDARKYVVYASDVKAQGLRAKAAVASWLPEEYPNSQISLNDREFPDIIITQDDGSRIGVEVMIARGPFGISPSRTEQVFRAHYEITNGILHKCLFVIVLENHATEQSVTRSLRHRLKTVPDRIDMRFGRMAAVGNSWVFQPSTWLIRNGDRFIIES